MATVHLLKAAARRLLEVKPVQAWKPLLAGRPGSTTQRALEYAAPLEAARARFSELLFGARPYSSVAAAVVDDDGKPEAQSPSLKGPESIRCFAIIAHVDHGKTTLLDQLLKQVGDSLTTERVMDSMSLEKERGITIAAKYTSLPYKGYTLNAVDTPGHADFGGEVERVLDMVDGAILLVDATEGPLAQTKFVLSKALRRGLRPLVLFNKVDRPTVTPQRCSEVESDLFDLFALLGATDEQLDFPVLYASAKEGWVTARLPSAAHPLQPQERCMDALLDKILEHVPPPAGDPDGPFKMLVSMTERDPFLGRILTGRIASGSVRLNDRVHALGLKSEGASHEEGRVTKIMKRLGGLGRVTMTEAGAGDIVSIAGLEKASVTDTVAAVEVTQPLPATPIDVPTIKMVMGVNDSPLGGRDGTHVTGSKIGERLLAEAENNVSIVVTSLEGGAESYEVQGRGELQLGVLIESMRREGYEMSVSPPAVLLQTGEGGQKLEPIEEVVVEVDDQYMGLVIEAMTLRKGELEEMLPDGAGPGRARLVFTCPSRGLIGYRSIFTMDTHGTGVMHRAFREYGPWRGSLDRVRKGALVSMAAGPSTTHALGSLESRGVLFIGPQEECYDGMIIGEHSRGEDLEVNPVRAKQLTNMRTSGTDEKVRLAPPRAMALEEAIGYVAQDELIEVTPKSVRLRKKHLNSSQRKSNKRRGSD